jgi:translation elongation factor EF-Ts
VALAEVNCETDFVARSDDFAALPQVIAHALAAARLTDTAGAAHIGSDTVRGLTLEDGVKVCQSQRVKLRRAW